MERWSREEWNVGVVRQTAEDIVRRGLVERVRWLPPMHPWRGLADPACYIGKDGERILFAEHVNHWNGRGEIWQAKVPPGDDLTGAVFRPWASATTHLSYPFPMLVQDDLYFTMETAGAGRLYLWYWRNGQQQQIELLDRPAIDPTFFRAFERWWLFCTFADNEPDKNLYLFFANRLEGPWSSHRSNPVKTDLASSRPAGPLFRSDGRIIRPSQDSTQSYGGALVLNSVLELTPNAFREQPIRRLTPRDEYPDGLHTLCPAGDHTILDGKRWGFSMVDPLRWAGVGTLKRYRRLRSRPFSVKIQANLNQSSPSASTADSS